MVVFTLVGGGNSTLCMAPLVCAAGFTCNILTRKPEAWSEEVEVVNEDMGYMHATSIKCKPHLITSDPAECIPQSDVVFFAGVPIHHNPALFRTIKPHLNKERMTHIGTVCAYGAFNWVAKRELGDEAPVNLFGTQLIPWCCGTREYGKTGVIFGAKRMLRVATESGDDPHNIKQIMWEVLRMKLVDTDFLACCLWPNNPSLHPPILYGLFKDFDGKTPYDPKKLPVWIYKEMCDASAEATETLDNELSSIVAALSEVFPENPHLKLNYHLAPCIMENYEDQVADSSTTASTVRTNAAFGKHKIPYTEVEGGIVPTLKHKFFETDLPFGLVFWKAVADMLGVEVPLTETIIKWNQALVDKEYIASDGTLTGRDIGECITPANFGLELKDLTDSKFQAPGERSSKKARTE
jgi:hypothetical protein